MASFTLNQLAERLGCSVEGDGAIEIVGVAALKEAVAGDISFLANPKYASQVEATHASAVIVSGDWTGSCSAALLKVPRPDQAFGQIAALFAPAPVPRFKGVHPSAVIGKDVKLGENVSIGPLCVVEDEAEIGEGTVLVGNVYVGYRVKIGRNCLIYAQVSLREYVQLGDRVIIHDSTVIGSDGFGYAVDAQGVRTKIPQIGAVEIGDDVEIGSNVSVDRARFGKTRIGKGVKIDNLVQIAHNVQIGDHAVIVAQVGISGSSSIGEKVIIAGQAGVAGHLSIGAGAVIGGQSGVTKDVEPGKFVFGTPVVKHADYMRSYAIFLRLPEMRRKLAELEKRLSKQAE
ncbi:MAG: UDP-3-O-(3-hydroxymyristoyl)glucosamine N-acyltransferase [Kiritimatiellae bacterium]|nr:UDP-3-O-(3-hydroxymyristoyl)glucosamine N-acyltransferase [Kiritimatiellia bacterium]